MVDPKQPFAKNQLLVVCTLILIAFYELHKIWYDLHLSMNML